MLAPLAVPFVCVTLPLAAQEPAPLTVDAKRRTADAEWKPQPTVTLDQLAGFAPGSEGLCPYGGLLSSHADATGFFRAEWVNGRWWLVDPDGHLFLTIGVCSVTTNETERGRAALAERFGSTEEWAAQTTAQLWDLGFNTLGCWSAWERFVQGKPRLPYTTRWNFMSGYGKLRGGTYPQPGHTGYPSDCIFVFDPEFEAFCEKHAQQNLTATKDDPYLLGHFSDNEMPFPADALDRYLALPETDPGHQAAAKWVEEHGAVKGDKGFGAEDRDAFLEYVSATYFRLVGTAIKRADPNHLYLGSRFHGAVLKREPVFRGAGPYVDVVSANYYGAWTPNSELMSQWAEWSGRPFAVTEWYAKGMDSGMTNVSGAGWTVKTQEDRGRFYQNFTLGLLKHPGCVGWHWFKYMDNDPTDTRADPSNTDSNKGLVSNTYVPWTPLCDAMRTLNHQACLLREFLQPPQ
jgi:hypothetical protein